MTTQTQYDREDVERWEKLIAIAMKMGTCHSTEEPKVGHMPPERRQEFNRHCTQAAHELGLDIKADLGDEDVEAITARTLETMPLTPEEEREAQIQVHLPDVRMAREYAVATGRAVKIGGNYLFFTEEFFAEADAEIADLARQAMATRTPLQL